MGIIWVRAVKRGFYPALDHEGNKIPGLGEIKYPKKDVTRGERAGAPFRILEEDFSPVRYIRSADGGKKEIGWMERVDGLPNEVPKKKVASEEEANASPVPIPHIKRRRRTKKEMQALGITDSN